MISLTHRLKPVLNMILHLLSEKSKRAHDSAAEYVGSAYKWAPSLGLVTINRAKKKFKNKLLSGGTGAQESGELPEVAPAK